MTRLCLRVLTVGVAVTMYITPPSGFCSEVNRRRPLPFVLGPGSLSAATLEHSCRAAILRIQHFSQELELLAAIAARRYRIGFEARKHFILKFIVKFVTHCVAHMSKSLNCCISYKVNIGSKSRFHGTILQRFCKGHRTPGPRMGHRPRQARQIRKSGPAGPTHPSTSAMHR